MHIPTKTQTPTQLTQNKHITSRSINHKHLSKILSQEGWENISNKSDANEAFNTFISTLQNLIKESTNLKPVNNRNKPQKPWITYELINMMGHRDRLMRLSKTIKDSDLTIRAKKYSNLTKKLIREARESYYRLKVKESKSDIKKLKK